MAAGKVIKAAMGGFQRSPSTPRQHRRSPSPTTTTTPSQQNPKSSSSSGFARYFPRTASSQVQPRLSTAASAPTISDLLRLVEELQEKESRLRTELLEQKILKETVAVVPFLEREIKRKDEELERERRRVGVLESENEVLRSEMEKLSRRVLLEDEENLEVERRIEDVESEIAELKRAVKERDGGHGDDVQTGTAAAAASCKRSNPVVALKKAAAFETKRQVLVEVDVPVSEPGVVASDVKPRIPRPPPTPTTSSSSSSSPSSSSSWPSVSSSESPSRECGSKPPPPPPLPPPPVRSRSVDSLSSREYGKQRPPGPGPPPPPPPPTKGVRLPSAKVRRVPEVVDFYHSLMRRDTKRETGSGMTDASTSSIATAASSAASAKDMIGEIENRSAYLHAIKSEVETQGDFIRFLIKEVENAAFTNIEDVVAFVKWLDDELSFLVDERAVLKHFDWPEKKADAMREAAFGYSDLKKVESEASSFRDDEHRNCNAAMKKMQALLEKLEHGVYNLSRVRESAIKRYGSCRIPWEWMLDTGLVSQIKLASVKLATKYMRKVSAELEAADGGTEEEDLVLQGVRFAFRVHQFAGGFDVDTMKAFQELRDKSRFQEHDDDHD